jgi:hypothetical protein
MKMNILNFLEKYFQKDSKLRFWMVIFLKILLFLAIINFSDIYYTYLNS